MYSMVLFPMQDHGGINHLLLPHTIFNLTSKGKEMVFWQYIFSPFLEIAGADPGGGHGGPMPPPSGPSKH